jgi:hypothetical protein
LNLRRRVPSVLLGALTRRCSLPAIRSRAAIGHVRQGELQFTLRKLDEDRIEVSMGGRVRLQRCL